MEPGSCRWCPVTGEGILKHSLDMILGKWL